MKTIYWHALTRHENNLLTYTDTTWKQSTDVYWHDMITIYWRTLTRHDNNLLTCTDTTRQQSADIHWHDMTKIGINLRSEWIFRRELLFFVMLRSVNDYSLCNTWRTSCDLISKGQWIVASLDHWSLKNGCSNLNASKAWKLADFCLSGCHVWFCCK